MKDRQNVKGSDQANKTDYILAEAYKMLSRTQQQIEDRKRQKQAYTETCNRDLQQLHKDEERLLNLIEVVKNK